MVKIWPYVLREMLLKLFIFLTKSNFEPDRKFMQKNELLKCIVYRSFYHFFMIKIKSLLKSNFTGTLFQSLGSFSKQFTH